MNKINFSNLYLYSYILFAFVTPLSRAGISLFFVIIVLLWLIEGDFKNKFNKIFSNKILVVILLLVGLIYLSLLWSSDVSLEMIDNIDYKYLLFIPISYTILKKEWTQQIITSFLAGMFVSEIISYGIYFELWTVGSTSPSNPTPFMNHIEYSVFLSFSAILLLSRLFSNYFTYKEKLFIFPFFLTLVGNLFLIGGRTGQIAFIAAVIVMFVLRYRISIKAILLSIITLIIIYISAYNISDTFKNRTNQTFNEINLISNGNLTSSIGIRSTYYLLLYDIAMDNYQNFFIGVGSIDFQKEINNILDKNLITKYRDFKLNEEFIRTNYTHNQYLQIFIEVGIIGLILFVYLIYLILKENYVDIEIKHISILFMTIFVLSCLSDTMIELQFPRSLFIIFISLFIVNIIEKNKKV